MEARQLELDDLYDLRRVGNPVVSPDGKRVAFAVMEADENEETHRKSLFVAPTDGSRDPHRLTRLPGAGSPKWSPDGSALAFVANRERDLEFRVGRSDDSDDEAGSETGRDENTDDADETDDGADGSDDDVDRTGEDRPQVWAFDLERGGDARQLTDFEEGVREFDWGPRGDRLVVSARDPTEDQREYLEGRREDDGPVVTERLQHKFDGAGWLDDVTTYLFVVDRETREVTRLDDAYGGGAMEPGTGLSPAWSSDGVAGTESTDDSSDSSDGSRIAFLSNRTERPDDSGAMDVYTISPDGSDLRRLTDGGLFVSDVRWRPDGERMAIAARDAENWYDTTDVLVADPDEADWTTVSAALDRTLSRAGAPAWVDDDTLLAPFADEGRTRLVQLRVGGDPERVYDRQGEYRTITGFDAAGGTVALALSSPDRPSEVYALPSEEVDAGPADDDPARRISALNADLLGDVETPTCERVRFENSDGEEIEAIAYLPADFESVDAADAEEADDVENDERDRLPLVVNVHGGPMAFDSPGFGFSETYWTGQGYAVLEVNYRGSSSYGQAFSEQIRGEWGPRETDDIVSGARELVERGVADPDRLFVTGFSQGGINSLYVITRTDEFAAAAPEHGIYDFHGLYGTADTQLWYENDLGLPWENPENYRDISTIQDVDEVETPTLVTAGEEDWRCPPWQAEQLYVRLKKRGVPSKLVVYPGEHHNVGDPDRAIHRLRTLTDWFERHDPATTGD
ncbi:S9 family peptidase [Halorussus sp. MSC15.2]|uniref:S9 family peptidase n=1 Tax=Halorussus sp. MSC15.2 TaxID=2283638 RepID=UPI0013D14089|nr:S9 family peptidase [Halorussus sp. MSC15.2]NEU56930.1 S9 family peptidase [Halorussus sp. MSC15.2]